MITTTIYLKENMLFSILKLPFVQKVELHHMSKQSKTTNCTYRGTIFLKDLNNFYATMKGVLTSEFLATIPDKLIQQRLIGVLLELEQTGKLKNKNFKRLCEYAEIYKFQVHNKKQYQQQIEIIKALSVKV